MWKKPPVVFCSSGHAYFEIHGRMFERWVLRIPVYHSRNRVLVSESLSCCFLFDSIAKILKITNIRSEHDQNNSTVTICQRLLAPWSCMYIFMISPWFAMRWADVETWKLSLTLHTHVNLRNPKIFYTSVVGYCTHRYWYHLYIGTSKTCRAAYDIHRCEQWLLGVHNRRTYTGVLLVKINQSCIFL